MAHLRPDGILGRDEPLALLNDALGRAAAGGRAAVLVSGESGIGKTELVRSATLGRQPVAWGTCIDDASAPGYWPWSQALDDLARTVGLVPSRTLAGDDAALLATVVPALGRREPVECSSRERWLLLDAVSRWLDRLAAVAPIVVVLDDLQWADASTLVLLDFVARAPRLSSVCLIGCYRQNEMNLPARAHLAALAGTADHIELGGIGREAVAALVAAVAGPVSQSTVDEIHRRAGGHPVFSRELSLLIAHGEDSGRIPLAVRDAIQHRVVRLPPPTRRVLEVAALTGNEVQPAVVANVIEGTVPEVEKACMPALNAGILAAHGDRRLRFAHDLYRETLAESVDPARRPPLHQAIGRALEDRLAHGGDVSPSELARHFTAAIVVDGATRAAHWAQAAAERDRRSLAFAEAAGHLRRWRAAVADAGADVDDHVLIEALIVEADALSRAGSPVDARGLLRIARDVAVRMGAGDRQAEVALAVAGLGAQFSSRRDDVVRELEEALNELGGEGAVEARVTAALARELQHSVAEDRPRAAVLSERALELGRDAGDAQTLLACLLARHDVLWTPGAAGARADVAKEIVAVAQRAGDDERRAEGLLLQANALLEVCSAAYLPVLESCLELLDRFGQPRHRYLAETRRAALALLRGELDEAEARIEAATAVGERIREPDTDNVRMSQRLELIRARGIPDQLSAFAAEAVRHWIGAPVHAHAVAAGFLARAGDIEAARGHVAVVLDLGTWRLDRSYLWSVLVRELSAAAIALHDHPLCEQLLADLIPLAGSCGVNGAVVAFAGSHAHTAGLLSVELGRDGEPLLRQAEDIYRRLGAPAWLDEVQRVRQAQPEQPSQCWMRRHGSVWHLYYDGEEAVVPHSKGLADLAALLARPGKDVHVLDLYGATDRSGSAGDIADRKAVLAYRRRLADLEEDAAEAAQHRDAERHSRIQEERQALVEELGRVTGLGNRRRTFSSYPAERARKAVAGRLRDTIRKLEHDSPRLAAHLHAAIVTGTYCRYRSDAPHGWHIEKDG